MVIKGKRLTREVLDKDEGTQWVSSALEVKMKNAQELPHSISGASSRNRFFQPSTSSLSNQSEGKPTKKAKRDSPWSR